MSDYCNRERKEILNILLFHGSIESLNHFSDELSKQLQLLGHKTDIINVQTTNVCDAIRSMENNPDVAICYDCVGSFSHEDIYDSLEIPVVNILMDHPMSLAYCMKTLPKKYIQLSPDENHVKYARRFLGVEHAFFAPHMASLNAECKYISDEEKKYKVLFPGGVRDYNEILQGMNERCTNAAIKRLSLEVLECLLENPSMTVEDALEHCMQRRNIVMDDNRIAMLLNFSKDIDLFVRMYYRSEVVKKIASAGIPITLVGGGWDRIWREIPSNVTILPPTNFVGVFPYMQKAQITLTVMPWFKAGTHDRIFNSLMHYSCPLTDGSSWLFDNFIENKECAYYSLEHLDKLPEQIDYLLYHVEERDKIIKNGRKKVLNHFTSKHIAEMVLMYLQKYYTK